MRYQILPELKPKPEPAPALTPRDKLARFLNMPITILVLTALLVPYVGGKLQDRSFKRNELFRIRLDRIAEAQREAARVRADVEMAFRALRMQEDHTRDILSTTPDKVYNDTRDRLFDQLTHSTGADTLRRSTIELSSLAETIGKPPTVAKATNQYRAKVVGLLDCVNNNINFDRRCSDLHDDLVSYAKAIVNAYGARADEHLAEQQ